MALQIRAGLIAGLTIVCLTIAGRAPLLAQGITTAAIRGSVSSANGKSVEDASIQVVNLATGYSTRTRAHDGRFLLQGLVTGGPYRIVVASLGYVSQSLDRLMLSLGEIREVSFLLVPLPGKLDTITVTAGADRPRVPAAGGVATSITDSALRRLPTLDRDMYDFVRLVPQAGTRFGLTGGGASFRYNSYVIDGVSDRQLQGNNTMGAGTIGGKTISLEAVKEYQVLLSPYDARYGALTGMLVNAVTKNGTNELHGSAYGYVRNAQMARTSSFVGQSEYRREQFGMSLGGPIVRNRVHFFIAPEFQHAEAPAPGPYVGQAPDVSPAVPVSQADIMRFSSLLRDNGIEPGDGGRVQSLNPAVTLFARVDIALPEWKSRVVVRDNYSSVAVTRFARPDAVPVFPLSSSSWTLQTAKHTPGVQVFTQISAAASNEFVFAYMDRPVAAQDYTLSPSVQANVLPASGVGTATLIAGPPAPAGGTGSAQVLVEIGDHVVLQPASRHTLGFGAHLEIFRYHAQGVRNSFGLWQFASLDALSMGDASSYSVSRDFGSAGAGVGGSQPSAYITDEWRIGDRLSFTMGVRADALAFSSVPAYNAAVDSVYHRRTSDYPRTRVQLSPRFGFTWEPFATERTRIRGGAGIFAGPPPLGWLLGPVRSNGAGVRTLSCTAQAGNVPKFVPDEARQPQMCRDGSGYSDGPVALVDRNLTMATSFRTSLAVDQRLPGSVNATVEALYSRVRSDFLFVNADLSGPQGIDARGRVLYGTIDATGGAHPKLISGGRFPEVIDLRNHSLGHSWSVTVQIEKPFSNRLELRASYTRSHAVDVQSLTNQSAVNPFDTWAGGRQLSGRHDELSTGISAFQIPDRVVLAATYAAPWTRWKTDLSLYYVGESGSPFTFGDSTAGRFGDLNADGTSADDPVYVPRDATDPTEIIFAGSDAVAQGAALERFIRETPCLRRQRGRILARNSCRGPWVSTSNASVRQSLQAIGRHNVSLQLEVFNVLNLMNASWGLFRVPNENVLQHTGQTPGPASQPIFHFDAASAGTSTQNLESGYQVQFSLRYSF